MKTKKKHLIRKNEQHEFKQTQFLPKQTAMVRANRLFFNHGQPDSILGHTIQPSRCRTQLGQLLRSIKQKIRVQDHFQLSQSLLFEQSAHKPVSFDLFQYNLQLFRFHKLVWVPGIHDHSLYPHRGHTFIF